ncbi:hypothetical protein CDAR_563691 [Caerostris darwini]|uniref:Uncharacterized protein n=1 Tax=Caerostris darwini TaxID=1538125 RepID=A0AAV4VDB4_9ARAC|nr:hypothetical protein CDAR_563691 [Caerostris darwini]
MMQREKKKKVMNANIQWRMLYINHIFRFTCKIPLMQVYAYVQQKMHRDLMISGGKSASELDNSREDHSSVPFLGGGGSWGAGKTVELSN